MKTTTINDLLHDKHLVNNTSFQGAVAKKPLRIVYGETYDSYGLTLDSLKYYFFTAMAAQLLAGQGASTEASVIIGDLHSVKNKIVKDKGSLLATASSRLAAINKVAKVYGLSLKVLLMSDLFEDADFKKRLAIITPIFNDSKEMQDIAKKTVLQNRLSQEVQSGFQYTLEEVALITGYDIKIGPPREVHYDKLAQLLGAKVGNPDFCGVYLRPTYPLGMGFDYFITHPEIEEFGLTPYKAGSNQLQANRIVLGVTSPAECKKLIDSSFISTNQTLPNPVLDVYIITQLAGHFLSGKPFEIDEDLLSDTAKLKTAAYEKLMTNIFKPLGYA